MQNLPRLMLVVTLLLLGVGWSVGAYLDGMEPPPEEVSVRVAQASTATVSMRDVGTKRRRAVVLSVDPTLERAVSLNH